MEIKRTSIIFANHYLISKGKGIIIIPAELTDEYKDLLINYYEGKDKTKIKKFLKEKMFYENIGIYICSQSAVTKFQYIDITAL